MTNTCTQKRIFSLILICVLLLSSVPVSMAEETMYGRVNFDNVRFRKTATTSDSGQWWCQLDTGWVVEILDSFSRNSTDWYKVRANIPNNPDRNYTGYLMAKFVTPMTAAEQDAWLKNPVQPEGSLAYTSTPGPNETPGPVVTLPPVWTPLPTIPSDGRPTTPPDANAKMYGRTTDRDVFFRQSPNSKIYWDQLPLGWLLEIESSTTDSRGITWYKVKGGVPSDPAGTYSGYIHGGFFKPLSEIKETPLPQTNVPTNIPVTPVPTNLPSLLPTPQPGWEKWGTVTKDKVFFRRSPSSSAGYWCYLNEGWPMEVLGTVKKGGIQWYKVQGSTPESPDKTLTGYIHSDFFRLSTETAAPTLSPTAPPSLPQGMSGYGLILVSGTNLRETASETGKAMTALNTGAVCQIMDSTNEKWTRILYNGMLGYVPAEAVREMTQDEYNQMMGRPTNPPVTYPPVTNAPVTLPPSTPSQGGATPSPEWKTWGTVTHDKVFFRRSPSTSAGYWCYLNTGWPMEVLGTVEKGGISWYRVKGGIPANPDRSYTGYIHSNFFRLSTDVTPVPTLAPTADPNRPGMSGFGLILVSGTNVRQSADEASSALTALPVGALCQILDNSNPNWIKILYGGISGYVPRNNLKELTQEEYDQFTGKITPIPTVMPTQTPSSGVLGSIRITADNVNLRKTPNGSTLTPTNEERMQKDMILPFYRQPVRSGSYLWIYVSYNGMFGYVRSDCYEITTQSPTVKPTVKPDTGASGYIKLTKGGVNLRKDPKTGGVIYGRLDLGTVLPYYSVTGNDPKWYYVFSEKYNTYGYIMATCAKESSADGGEVKPPLPPSTGYAATSADKVFIRKGASTSSDALGQVPKANTVMTMWGAPVQKGSVLWLPVHYNGVQGYIHGKFAYQLAQWQVDQYLGTGVLPTPTPAPTEAPKGDSDYIMIDADSVWVRSGPGTQYNPVGKNEKVHTGEVFKFTKKVQSGSVTWYRIVYNVSTIGYIHGNFAHVMSKVEYNEWQSHQTPALPPVNTPTPPPVKPPETIRTLRLGSSGEDVETLQMALAAQGFLKESEISGQYLSSTVDAVKAFQKANKLTVDGVAGPATQNRLYGISSGGNSDGSSVEVHLNPVEYVDWYTGDIQKVFPKGGKAIVTDVYTGISFRVRRWSGGYHADVEPLTAADTAAICRIYGTVNAQEISDRESELQSWRRRPLWITIGDRTFAASMYGVPHNYPAGDTIPDNEYNGQFCIHFVNSKTHRGNEVDYDRPQNGYFGHQSAIKYAYEHSVSGNK